MCGVTESTGRPGDGHADRLASAAAVVRLAIALTLSVAGCASTAPAGDPKSAVPVPGGVPAPQETPEQVVSDLQQNDPGSPLALEAHLEYASQLVNTRDAACETRLSRAQTELDVAAADPSFDVVLPLGPARLADLQYRLHAARASCQALAPQREVELQRALTAAQQAVEIYQEALDYPSMTVAQFNVAVTQRLLGDNGASVASLETAIALDKEFGLHQDAMDNSRLLALWRGDSGSTNAGSASADFPTRSVTLKSWQPGEAEVSVQVDEASVIDAHSTHDEAHGTFDQRVRRDSSSWVVSYQPGTIAYGPAQWSEETSDVRELAMAFERGLGIPAVQVGLKGDFQRVPEVQAFSKEQLAAARALMLDHMDPERGSQRVGWADRQMMQIGFMPATIQIGAAENYNLQVGMWSGATLEQGVWYKLAAPLTLAGARQLVTPNDIEFAYTRDVPCTGAATQHSCVEIVVHASPQAEAVRQILDRIDPGTATPLSSHVHYWSATYARIVMDPATLGTRVYDVHRYWHLSNTKAVNERFENRSERIVTTFTYH